MKHILIVAFVALSLMLGFTSAVASAATPKTQAAYPYCTTGAASHYSWQNAHWVGRPASGHIWCIYDPGTGDHLDWQQDGNFVLYSNYGDVLWRSDTARNYGRYLYFSTTGNIDIFNYYKKLLWTSNAYANSYSHATKHYDLGFAYIDEDNNSTSGCPYENYLVTAQGFVYTHSPKLWDYLYPWAIRTSTGQDYSGNRAAQHCDKTTSR